MSDISLSGIRIVLAGHGSRDPDGVAEFEQFAATFKARHADSAIEHGYLEFQSPTIEQAVSAVAKRGDGSGPIVVLPALLAAATHAKSDMPSILNRLRQQFPLEDIRYAAVLDLHEQLLKLCERRVCEAEARSSNLVRRSDTCLVVVGRGTTDPDANGDIAKLTRMLHEGMSMGASFVCYSGTAEPLVHDGLKSAALLGLKRIIVLPYFLFDGVLVKRIFAAADALQKRVPDLEVLKAEYLGADKAVCDVLAERTYEAVHGQPSMNCGLCKYRAPIVGYENQVGLPQRPHRERPKAYEPHPIEARSYEIIESMFDWEDMPAEQKQTLIRLVHTTGDFECTKDMFFSPGAVESGVRALLRTRRIITDVTMVQTGLKRSVLSQLGVETWCGVHDEQTALLAGSHNITRSAAGIRRAWQKFGNDAVITIGDAPTAVVETVRLIREHGWRPQLVVAVPVGFVGTVESKELLKSCLQVPRITNSGTRGGSPWAAAIINSLLIQALNGVAEYASVNA